MEQTPVREDKRKRILAAAAEVFDSYGYADATIDMVAAAAAVAKGSVYNYFTSKQELYTAVFMQQMAVQETDLLARFENTPSPLNQLMLLFDHWYERYSHHKDTGRLVLECWASAARETHSADEGPMAGMLHGLYARWRERMADIVARGQETGHFRPDVSPVMTAQVLMGMLDGLLLHGIIGMGVVVDDEFVTRMKRGFMAVVGTKEALTAEAEEPERDSDL